MACKVEHNEGLNLLKTYINDVKDEVNRAIEEGDVDYAKFMVDEIMPLELQLRIRVAFEKHDLRRLKAYLKSLEDA